MADGGPLRYGGPPPSTPEMLPRVWCRALNGMTTIMPMLQQLHVLPVRMRVDFKMATVRNPACMALADLADFR